MTEEEDEEEEEEEEEVRAPQDSRTHSQTQQQPSRRGTSNLSAAGLRALSPHGEW